MRASQPVRRGCRVALATPALVLVSCAVAHAATGDAATGSSFKDVAQGIAIVVGVVIALLGAPGVLLGIKKSQAEIRKLELETAKLQSENPASPTVLEPGPDHVYNVVVEGEGNVVSIVADPRLLGPLLLLLDFVCATVILTIAGYLVGFGNLYFLSPLLALVGLVLFVPIYREAKRLKRMLTVGVPDDQPDPANSC
jgi:hypothetical protein